MFSLSYAAYHRILFISARDQTIIKATEELDYLKDVEVCGFEYLLLQGFLRNENKNLNKTYKAVYKSYCIPAIKSGIIPRTFSEFVRNQCN